MANNNGYITLDVNQSDVQAVLGISSSINKWSELCTHTHIVKWAKYKPIRYNAKGVYDQYDQTNERWKSDAVWWIGDHPSGQRWGMRFPMFNSSNSPYGTTGTIDTRTSDGKTYREPTAGFFYDMMHDSSLRWTYLPPQGEALSSPFRIVDFMNYNHKSPNPLPFTFTRTLYVTGATDTRATYNADCEIRNPDDLVTNGLRLDIMIPPSAYVSAVPNLGECYMGVLFYNTVMDDCFWQCATEKISQLYLTDPEKQAKALRVSLTDADFTNQYNKNHKDWNTKTFLCSKSLGYCETLTAYDGHYLIACDDAGAVCTFAVAGQIIISEMKAAKVGTNITVIVQIQNNTGSSKTVTTPKVDLVSPGSSIVQDTHTWSNVTISNGDTAVLSYTFTNQLDNNLNAVFTGTCSGETLRETVSVVVK